jgi:hypothetical protein
MALSDEMRVVDESLPADLAVSRYGRRVSNFRHILPSWISKVAQLEAEVERHKTLQTRIAIWGRNTFGDGQRVGGIYAHLVREVEELGECLPEIDPDELADCGILLLELAEEASVFLLDEIEKKHKINQQREWGPVEPDGAILHVESENRMPSNQEVSDE